MRLSIPDEGIRSVGVLLRLPRVEHVGAVSRAFADPELREAGNLPDLDRSEVLETLPHLPALAASGRLLPLVVVDTTTGEILGGATRPFPPARGRGIATRTARLLAEHAFSLGVQRNRGLRQPWHDKTLFSLLPGA